MPEGTDGDTERLHLIQAFDRALAAKQLGLKAALAERDQAKERYAAARRNLAAIGQQLRDLETAVHLKVGAAYLNGESLDRGVLSLGNEALQFSGWQGKVTIPLQDIREVEVANSLLSPLAGVPFLGGIWPGKPRPGYTLLLNVNDGTPSGALAVVADLRNAAQWQEGILARQQGLEDVARQRAELMAAREQAEAEVRAAGAALTTAQANLRAVRWEVAELKRLRDRLQAQQDKVEAFRKRVQARLQAQQHRAEVARRWAGRGHGFGLLRRETSHEQETRQPHAEMP